MTISGAQCRAARGLIGWSQTELCEAAGVGRATLANFEAQKSTPYDRTLRDIELALQGAGVIFLDGDYAGSGGQGVRLAQPTHPSDEGNRTPPAPWTDDQTPIDKLGADE